MRRWCSVLARLFLLCDVTVALQTFLREPSDQYVRLGQNVVLPCQVSNVVGRVQWTRDEFGLGIIRDLPSYPRYQMIGDDQEGTFSLEIQRVQLEDDAVFQCQVGAAVDEPGIRSRNAHLTVLVPPEPPRIVEGSSVTAEAGSQVELHCESVGGKPPAEVEWYDSDSALIENASVTEVSLLEDGKRSRVRSTLTLPLSVRHHNTSLTCQAHNSALSAPQRARVHLHVQFPPQLSLHVQPPHAREHQDLVLNCQATANPNQVRYRWYLNGEPMLGQSSERLTLPKVTRRLNNATVRCEVTNAVGTSSQEIHISVLYAPRFLAEPEDVAAGAGEEAVLVCDVDANPPAQITWIRRDCDSCEQVVGYGGRLRLPVGRQTAGRYECRVRADGFAPVSRQLSLLVRSRPEVTGRASQLGRPGQTVHVECRVTSVPPPNVTLWTYKNQPIPIGSGRYGTIEEPVFGGLRSVLVIADATQEDFGLYNCSFGNEYGVGSAVVLLQQEARLSLFAILAIVFGSVIVATTLVLVIVGCRRYRQKTKKQHKTPEPVVFEAVKPAEDGSSSGSDLKLEIRTASSGSEAVISDRWHGWSEDTARPVEYVDLAQLKGFNISNGLGAPVRGSPQTAGPDTSEVPGPPPSSSPHQPPGPPPVPGAGHRLTYPGNTNGLPEPQQQQYSSLGNPQQQYGTFPGGAGQVYGTLNSSGPENYTTTQGPYGSNGSQYDYAGSGSQNGGAGSQYGGVSGPYDGTGSQYDGTGSQYGTGPRPRDRARVSFRGEDSLAQHVVDARLKPGTLATHV